MKHREPRWQRPDESDLRCLIHGDQFIKFAANAASKTFGCPVCVGLIRARVRRDRARWRKRKRPVAVRLMIAR